MSGCAAIILAAGASSRLGEPKQLVMLAGERLLERAVRVAHEAGCAPIVVVLGAAADRVAAESSLGQATIVINDAWEEGMASSIRAGVAALTDELEGVILLTCDQPAVTADHLRLLSRRPGRAASAYAGRRGIPAYFPSRDFKELLLLRGDAGARSLLECAPAYELAGGELDVDTPEALRLVRGTYG